MGSKLGKIFFKIGLPLVIAASLTGCGQAGVRYYGGEMTVKLDPGIKLEDVTWKENSLWYLTRPMRGDEEAETHTFQQDSQWGVFEGTVTIVEKEK